jgi:hypothetical protein
MLPSVVYEFEQTLPNDSPVQSGPRQLSKVRFSDRQINLIDPCATGGPGWLSLRARRVAARARCRDFERHYTNGAEGTQSFEKP